MAHMAKRLTLFGVFLIGILGLVLFSLILSTSYDHQPSTAHADDQWSVFLLNQDPIELVRVDADGTSTTYDLGITDMGTFGGQLAVAPNGTEAAYCSTSVTEDGTLPVVHLIIRDLENNSTRIDTEIGNSDGCRISSQSYSADSSVLAVGLINPAFEPVDTAWRLLIIDTATGEIAHELNADDGVVVDNAETVGLYPSFMPEPRLVMGNEIIFTQIPWRSDGLPTGDGVRWNWMANTLTVAPHWGNYTADWVNETGDLVWAGLDAARPAAEPGGPLPQSNVAQVMDANTNTLPIYYTGDYVVIDTVFINSGREIAVYMLEGFDPDNPPQGNQPTHWIAIDRSGNVRDLHRDLRNFSQMVNAPDGYALLNIQNPAMGESNFNSTLTLHHNGQEEVLWQADRGFWMIVGGSKVAAADDLIPFNDVE